METRYAFLASFTYSSEAQIYKGLLESSGIDVFLRDEFTTDANPMFSNAVGGVKLYVNSENLEQARTLLKELPQHSMDDSGKPVECPFCHEPRVDLVTSVKEKKTMVAFVIALLFGGLPLYAKHRYKCANCGAEFEHAN